MAKEKRTPWTVRSIRAGMILVVACGIPVVGSVLFLHLTRTAEPAPSPPMKRVVLEDRSVLVSVEEADGDADVESVLMSEQPKVGHMTVTSGQMLAYSPPPNFNGKVSAGLEACWVGRGCRDRVVAITVRAVNDTPTARDDAATTGRGKPVAIDVLANDSDPDGDRLSIRSVSDARSGGRGRIAGNWILWTPGQRFQGETSFSYTAADKHGGSSRASVTILVVPSKVNPTTGVIEFLPPAGPATPEGPRDPFLQPLPPRHANRPPRGVGDRVSVPAGGTVIVDVLANDRDPDGDPLSIASVDIPERGAAKLVGDRIQFSAPLSADSTISFAYSVADDVGATDRSRVSVLVRLVNQAPTFTAGPDQTALEDGAQHVSHWARDIVAGAAGEAGQSVAFLVSTAHAGLFSVKPEIHPDGSLTYTPAANANGIATVTVRARDDGGTANGGRDTSARKTFRIRVKT